MTLYALEVLDDALDATQAFLTPVDTTRWLKLALVVLFVGIPGASPGSIQWPFGGSSSGNAADGPPPADVLPDLGPGFWLGVAALVGIVVLVGLLYLLVGSIMEFVLVESLRDRSVTIRASWGRRWRQGVRVFAFRLLVGALAIGPMLAVGAVVVLTGFDPIRAVTTPLVFALVLLVPAYLLLVAVLAVVNGFTTVFVVPIMILDDESVLGGWRRLWRSIRTDPEQYAGYLLASIVLGIAGSMVVGFATVAIALLLLVPFGVLFGLGFALIAIGLAPIGIPVVGIVGIVYGLVVLAVAALASVPVVTYLRYYALLVLGDVDPALDLITEQRDAIRTPDDDTASDRTPTS